MSTVDRKKEVVDICLKTFMQKGLSETSVRDLSSALNLQSGGIYWYFKDKDEAIIACAEEAALRIENDLIGVALNDIDNPDKLADDLKLRAIEMRPLMKFFVSVCALEKYEQALSPALSRLSQRYKYYVEKFAEKLECDEAEIAPYVYIVINTILSYMLFGKSSFTAPQITMAKGVLKTFLERRDSKHAKNGNLEKEAI